MATSISLVWFKRDLRTQDHAPLAAAVAAGRPLIGLFFFEPSLAQAPEYAPRHWRFQLEAVQELQATLKARGLPLFVLHQEVLPVLQALASQYHLAGLYSHQETGLKITFDRDRAVQAFCRTAGIPWWEFPQDGVIRGLRGREHWQQQWDEYLQQPLVQPDWSAARGLELSSNWLASWSGPPLPEADWQSNPLQQKGGESLGGRYLQSFLAERAQNFSRHLSKPLESRRSCSRLSPYLAWGNLSARQVYQAVQAYREHPNLQQPLDNFLSRLWWRSHYIQKLETEWQIEFEPINRGLADLDRGAHPAWFAAWASGHTGYPLVDASMRCLAATGWVNFRMRAMLATFVTFTLWQDWRQAAQHLARLFLDFEPGIHYAQFQMQAGLTGYHPLRIFNPLVNATRHDPAGTFVRQWVPELASVPAPQILQPWRMTSLEQGFYGCRLGLDYPLPVVDYDAATRQHKERYWTLRQRPEVQQHLPAIWARHCLPHNAAAYQEMAHNQPHLPRQERNEAEVTE